jgi:hypothetical protein
VVDDEQQAEESGLCQKQECTDYRQIGFRQYKILAETKCALTGGVNATFSK